MSKPCPLLGVAVSADCVDCEEKACKDRKYKTICIGIDQSYSNTGISLSADGKLLKIKHIELAKYNSHSERRGALGKTLDGLLKAIWYRAENIICVFERIRLYSQNFLNIDYIKQIGALNAVIIDIMHKWNVPVYSVDTRCWKSSVIGTSKGAANSYGVPEEKWPAVQWCIKQGFEDSILRSVEGRKQKGTFMRDGNRYMYDNDASDSAGISMFWFVGDRDKLQEEH